MKRQLVAATAVAVVFWAGAAYALVENTGLASTAQAEKYTSVENRSMTSRQVSLLCLASGLMGLAGLGRLRASGSQARVR